MINKSEERNIIRNVIFFSVIISVILWIFSCVVGLSNFNPTNAISIYGTMVQGMSALLSVSIAVIIFRIQSLENKVQSLEQYTLDYIFRISKFAYAYWIPSVEEHIRSGIIVTKYYLRRKEPLTEEKCKEIEENRDSQQKSLIESLKEHDRIKKTIQKTKNGGYQSFILLIFPILASFYAMMLSDGLTDGANFFAVSIVILASILGIFSLIKTVIDSILVE